MAQYPIIDVWAQPVLAESFQKLPEVLRLFEQSGSVHLLGQDITPDQLVDIMDNAGIERLMLAAWCRPEGWIITNEQVADFTQQYPDRFVGMATVNLHKPVEAVRELDRAVHDYGFKALRIVPWLWKLPPNDKLYYPLYVKCVELDIPFCTQVGHTGPLMPSETGRPVPYVDDIALTFPELKIVCGHIGHPWTDEMIGVAWKHANVYIDTSAYLPRYYPQQLLRYMQTYGSEKVLFGTNFPQLDLKKCVQQALELDLSDEARENFLWRNAQRVFDLS